MASTATLQVRADAGHMIAVLDCIAKHAKACADELRQLHQDAAEAGDPHGDA